MSVRPLGLAAALLSACCAAESAHAAIVPVEVRHAVTPGRWAPAPNRLYVTVEVCDPDGACIQVPDVVVDTASAGLRLDRAALGDLRLDEVIDAGSGAPLRACARLAQGTIWGKVVKAQVRLGELSTRWAIPIQTYTVQTGHNGNFDAPEGCGSRRQDLAQNGTLAGNGVLGIGPQHNDCQFSVLSSGTGSADWERLVGACPLVPDEARYFAAAPRGGWIPVDPHPSERLLNPVAALPPGHDDGVVLQLGGGVPNAGLPLVRGRLGVGLDAAAMALFASKPRALAFELWSTVPIKVNGELGNAEIVSSAQSMEFSTAMAAQLGVDVATKSDPCTVKIDLDSVTPHWLELLRNPLLAQQQPPPRPMATMRVVNLESSRRNPTWWRNAAQPCAATINPNELPLVTLGLPFFYGRTLGIGLPSPEYPRGYLLY